MKCYVLTLILCFAWLQKLSEWLNKPSGKRFQDMDAIERAYTIENLQEEEREALSRDEAIRLGKLYKDEKE